MANDVQSSTPNRPRKTPVDKQEQILRESLTPAHRAHNQKPKEVSVLGNHMASGIRQQIWRPSLKLNSSALLKRKGWLLG